MSNFVQKYISCSASQTKKIGERISKEIFKEFENKKALIIGLQGELGSGKTSFLKGFVRPFGVDEKKILSPTFIIMRRIPINFKKFRNFYHIDCYRIKNKKDLENLNFFTILKNPKNIVAIEWVEKIKKFLPDNIISLKFRFLNKKIREIIVKYNNKKSS